MPFDQIKNKTPRTKGKCGLCGKADKVGSIGVTVRDLDTKVVASRSTQVCEACGVKAYEAAVNAAGM